MKTPRVVMVLLDGDVDPGTFSWSVSAFDWTLHWPWRHLAGEQNLESEADARAAADAWLCANGSPRQFTRFERKLADLAYELRHYGPRYMWRRMWW